MILDRIRGVTADGEAYHGDPGVSEGNGCKKIPVSVVFTNIEGTLAALNAAAHLSVGLGAQIVVLATEVVSFRYLAQGLSDSLGFFQRLCEALVNECRLQDVSIEVHLCRDQVECLKSVLRPRSIVLIGARRRWWPWRERGLQRALKQRGFDALLVYAKPGHPGSHSQSVVQRMLEEARQASH